MSWTRVSEKCIFFFQAEDGIRVSVASRGLGCENLIYLMDWNDHGIDEFANSTVVNGKRRIIIVPRCVAPRRLLFSYSSSQKD